MPQSPIVKDEWNNGSLLVLAAGAASAATYGVTAREGVRILAWTAKPLVVSPIVVEQGQQQQDKYDFPRTPSYNQLLGRDVISTPCSTYMAQYDVSPSHFVPSSVFSPESATSSGSNCDIHGTNWSDRKLRSRRARMKLPPLNQVQLRAMARELTNCLMDATDIEVGEHDENDAKESNNAAMTSMKE